MTARPPPWRVVEGAGCFIVQDATEQNVAWFYFPDSHRGAVGPSLDMLNPQRARRVLICQANILKTHVTLDAAGDDFHVIDHVIKAMRRAGIPAGDNSATRRC
jgi:hypothetical protein